MTDEACRSMETILCGEGNFDWIDGLIKKDTAEQLQRKLDKYEKRGKQTGTIGILYT